MNCIIKKITVYIEKNVKYDEQLFRQKFPGFTHFVSCMFLFLFLFFHQRDEDSLLGGDASTCGEVEIM